ncbi:zf-CCHC domain-containing protein [Tanacetum coccineum]|uniref:Zf-CCHC domain-containing protein n=1 Tax=Tanacetum coccineum TaxID=301880 RepID=A0ABQ4XSZ3_9ASTR
MIPEEESIDNAFAKFNIIITSLKALDESFSSKNYVRKFLRALHPKWRAKVTAIEESKNLTTLSHDELIGNLKIYEEIIMKDFQPVKAKENKGQPYGEKNPIPKKSKTKKWQGDRKCFKCGDPNHLVEECPKLSRYQNQKAFIGGSWSDSDEDEDEKTNDEKCLMTKASNEGPRRVHQNHLPDCLAHICLCCCEEQYNLALFLRQKNPLCLDLLLTAILLYGHVSYSSFIDTSWNISSFDYGIYDIVDQ